MKRLKSLFTTALITLLSVAFILPIAACVNGGEGTEGDDGNNAVYVTSKGGMALKNVTVELLKGDSRVGAKLTNEEGKVTYNLDTKSEYKVKLADVPAGFLPEESYTVKGSDETTYIRLDSKIIGEGKPKNLYKTGDVLYDFEETYYTYNGTSKKIEEKKAKLSDFFSDGKKAVLINFFYNGCSACNAEYPYLRDAYIKYADKLEILGINDIDPTQMSGETLADMQALVQRDQVPYLMCKDNAAVGIWFKNFVSGYPTSIMIDRYGILCEVLMGNNTSQSFWEEWFEKYTSDKYVQKVEPDDSGDIFTPDVPNDFNVSMPASSELNTTINNTGRNVIFSAYGNNSSYGWPWDLTENKTAIYPTNSGHRGTMAVIYAQIDLKQNEVLAFDYKLSTLHENDYFYVSLDSREGTGRQISMTSGVQDWQTGYSYAALEDGRHEIEFSYYRSTTNHVITLEDKVYIKNLRIVTIDAMNAELAANKETFEVPYFATRSFNNKTKQYDTIENVYLAKDGYYHIGTGENDANSVDNEAYVNNDPYLLLDVTHSTPYFGRNSESLYTLLNLEIANSGGLYIKGKDYTDTFRSYVSFSTNSAYTGLIPVTQEIRNTITALYKDNISEDAKYYSEDGWLQFCVYYKQYGIQKDLSDPIKGLAYFSAFEAVETVGSDNYVYVGKGNGQFMLDEKTGHYVDVEGTSKADEGTHNLNPTINKVHFETVLMPRGYMYKFVPSESGVYSINGIDCYYYKDDESIVDGEETDAELYDGSLNVSHAYARPIASSDSDRYERNNIPDSFKIVHYLEAGKTYYINVAFRVVETTGDFAFRIDYLGKEYSYISQASSNLYTLDENSKMVLPLYCEPYYDETNDVWLDSKGGGTIFVDFTQLSAMFDYFTIEQILDEDFKTAQYKFRLDEDIVYTTEKENGEKETITIHFDLEKTFSGKDKIPDVLKGLEIKDYTDRMKYYLEQSKKDKEVTDPEYGLVPANKELYGILQLFNAKFFNYDTPDEWLKACCFRLNVNVNNRG